MWKLGNANPLDCPICGAAAEQIPGADGNQHYNCSRHGAYALTGSAWGVLFHKNWTGRQIANACGWLSERQDTVISSNDIKLLGSLRLPSVPDRAMKILRELERRSTKIGQRFDFELSNQGSILEWLSVSWSEDTGELQYLLEYLIRLGVIEGKQGPGLRNTVTFANVVITPAGYQLLSERRGGTGSAIGFCAMWFDQRLMPLWTEAIYPAIDGAGYKPERTDSVEHNNRIDDEMMATIRKSRFIVADFTGNRGGVYFEAGFAIGLGIPVIWTTRKERLHRIHFDTRQYNFVDWTETALPEFKSKLQSRIEATLGQGPLRR